jgi:AcrR family transcriptional regulator
MPARTHNPRERMVYSASQLIRRDGVTATGMRDVAAHADAPRGSLQHYFPGGKDQMVAEAARWGGGYAARQVGRFVATLGQATPGALFEAMAGQWRDEFTRQGYASGCPVAASIVDGAGKDTVRGAAREAFAGWRAAVVSALRDMDVRADRAESLATLMISAIEGAILMARAERDVRPLDIVVTELRLVLDGAAARVP